MYVRVMTRIENVDRKMEHWNNNNVILVCHDEVQSTNKFDYLIYEMFLSRNWDLLSISEFTSASISKRG